MKAKAIAARFKRTFTGAFAPTSRETPVPAPETTGRHIDPMSAPKLVEQSPYFVPSATSASDAWQIIKEHRAHLSAAIAAGVFVTRIR